MYNIEVVVFQTLEREVSIQQVSQEAAGNSTGWYSQRLVASQIEGRVWSNSCLPVILSLQWKGSPAF